MKTKPKSVDEAWGLEVKLKDGSYQPSSLWPTKQKAEEMEIACALLHNETHRIRKWRAEKVCKWSMINKYKHKVSCGAICHVNSLAKIEMFLNLFKFCPYCGGRIEVVR